MSILNLIHDRNAGMMPELYKELSEEEMAGRILNIKRNSEKGCLSRGITTKRRSDPICGRDGRFASAGASRPKK